MHIGTGNSPRTPSPLSGSDKSLEIRASAKTRADLYYINSESVFEAPAKLQCGVQQRFDEEVALLRHRRKLHIGSRCHGYRDEAVEALPGRQQLNKVGHLGQDAGDEGYQTRFGYRAGRLLQPIQRDKPYKCSVCGYSSSYKCNLSRHLLRHTGHKPHKCRICEYSTADMSQLCKHIRSKHPDAKQFKCTVCEKVFVAPTLLRAHLRSHIG